MADLQKKAEVCASESKYIPRHAHLYGKHIIPKTICEALFLNANKPVTVKKIL